MDVVALIIGVALGLAIGFAYAMRVKSRGAAAEAALLQSQGRIDQLEKHNADLTGQNQQQSELKQLFETTDRKSTRLNSSHIPLSRMPSSA